MAKKETTDQAKASDVLLMPPTTTVKSLAAEHIKLKKRSSEITGTYGQLVADAAEKKHVDKKALSMAISLNEMSDERLAITLPHLLRYIDDLGLTERSEQQAQLFADAEEGDEPAGRIGKGNGRVNGKGKPAKGGGPVLVAGAVRDVAEKAGAKLNH
jgi:hypothetical protein